MRAPKVLLLIFIVVLLPAAAAQEWSGMERREEKREREEEKPFDEVIKDMEKLEGLFTLYRKADENKVLIELKPGQFDKDYLFSAKVERGVGERGLYGAMMMDEFVFNWRRIGKRVQLVRRNVRFRASSDSPVRRAVEKSFSDSIFASGKVASKPHPDTGGILVDLGEILLSSDLHNMAQRLENTYKTPFRFDKENGGFGLLRSFPLNVELEALAHFRSDKIRERSVALPDPRSLQLSYRYSLVELPETGYRPRLGDDRIGHFLAVHQDFTSDERESPYVRYITRWHLEKADPKAKLSPPKQPIVFWLENSIPLKYRDAIKEGVLVWNKAFERIGFKDAMEARQQPDDADWDPSDVRYNTIRWFVAYDASFAIGPSHVNPITGQIIDADIGISEGIFRVRRREFEEVIEPLVEPAPGLWPHLGPRFACDFSAGLAQQAAFGYELLQARGDLTPEMEERFMRQLIIGVVAHEVGHTLGLRHNFRASTVNQLDRLHDARRTSEVGLSGSVMDYNPPNIAVRGEEEQGDFFMTTLGSYDYWAVEYAYKPMENTRSAEEELSELQAIAARGADPLLAYATDEDALGLSPRAIDPRSNQWDLSGDPLGFFEKRVKLARELWSNMEQKLLKPGKGYQVLRRAFNRSWNQYATAALNASKYIGGIYHHRDHYGDPNGRPPYLPVPASEQRRALEFLKANVFGPEAFAIPPRLLNRLAVERFQGLNWAELFQMERVDYPIHSQVLAIQRALLDRLYNQVTLNRLLDLEVKFEDPSERFAMADMFAGIRTAVWSELDGKPGGAAINSFRRNLQREHLKKLVALVLEPAPKTPEDARTLARADLIELGGRIEAVLRDGGAALDAMSRAHLIETGALIKETLEARLARSLK